VLLAITWRLWTPQNVFPRVPLFEFLVAWPLTTLALVDWSAAAVSGVGLAYLSLGRSGCAAKLAALLVATAALVLCSLDQHRLQPWLVHVVVSLLLVTCAQPLRRTEYLRWFTASIYIYSALGKFDAQFLHTVGQDFVGMLLHQMGGNIAALSENARFWLAACLPIAELCVGCGLACRRMRVPAACGAVVMHSLLLAVLGPWGLGHAWGVLAWNLLFIVVVILLCFWPDEAPSAADEPTAQSAVSTHEPHTPSGRFGWVEVLLLIALLAPLGERLGVVDHWLGWALYAPHSSRARIEISAAAVQELPAVVQPFIVEASESELIWREVRIDRWSLAVLGAPVYPQQRFQVGVARALAASVGEREIRVRLLSVASRWSGRRTEQTLAGKRELEAAASRYWFNTRPVFAPASAFPPALPR
jgi:hypothetical protein